MRDEQLHFRTLLRSYPEIVNYPLKKNASKQATAEYDSEILRYEQPKIMTPLQFADDLMAKLGKVADLYHKSTVNDVFIERVNASIGHSLGNYCTKNPKLIFAISHFNRNAYCSSKNDRRKPQRHVSFNQFGKTLPWETVAQLENRQ